MDYSGTVNLPVTDFPMRANLPQKEPQILSAWEKENLYGQIQDSRKDAPLYILHDGPPYANGHIHLGHALNKVLKDIIVKHKTMKGFRVPYVPGWDCHGLPIELNVTRELGDKSKAISKADIRKKCRDNAEMFVNIQMEEFKRLGVLGDYEHPYLTMNKDYEADIVEIFGKLFKEGYIYRSKKPIYWCPDCATALAEAEVEYGSHTSDAVYVKFRIDPSSVSIDGVDKDRMFAVIWTTTPWTLPANLGLCFHKDFEYSVFRFGNEYYLLAKELLPQMKKVIGSEPSGEWPVTVGSIETLKAAHPFIDRESKILFGPHVTLEQGTGIVHTAPGHGHEDYITGLRYGLDVFCPVDDNGRFTDEYSPMKGINVFDANDKIIEVLKEKNVLISNETIEHSYPHCWRCHKPLIFRATEQWFFNIDHNGLRQKCLQAIDKTQWVPLWGESRFRGMAETRPDWCLSRQRSWGVPIPSFRCEKCDKNLMSAETIEHFALLARKENLDIWYTDDIKNLIPGGLKCSCGGESFIKEYDILDVWFDSGISHFAVLDKWPGHRWPSDSYLEGSDQHRGWFQSSIWPALALRDAAPFKTVITHGFLLDENGKAMSKSIGNVIPPEKIVSQYGADILRLWVSSEDYRNDMRIGLEMIKQIADSYRRIRNTFKYIIGNISGFKASDILPYSELDSIDKWILHKLYDLSRKIINHYENFEFHMVYRRLLNFCAVELSSIYFDISKDTLYVEAKNSKKRLANLSVLYEINETLVRLVAPIIPFTAEEIWKFLSKPGSVHTQDYYNLREDYNNPEIEENIEKVVDIKKDVLKALELIRKEGKIKVSLEAEVNIFIEDDSARKICADMGDEFKRFLQTAKAMLVNEKHPDMTDYDSSSVSALRTAGVKCIRCWNYHDSLGSDPEHPELCPRCTEVIRNL